MNTNSILLELFIAPASEVTYHTDHLQELSIGYINFITTSYFSIS